MAEALNNIKQVKFAMDGFASDWGGLYPNELLHPEFGTSGSSSNHLFRQLFVADATDSEAIFWVKESNVASEHPPDDNIGNPHPADLRQPLRP